MIFDFVKLISKQIQDNVPGLNSVSIWKGQYNQTDEHTPVNAPCVYLDIEDVRWEDGHQGAQEGFCDLAVHFVGGYMMHGEQIHEDDYESQQLEDSVFLYLDRIHQALGTYQPKVTVGAKTFDIASKLMRVSTQPVPGFDALQIWVVRYRCKLYDTINWRYREMTEHQVQNLLIAYQEKVMESPWLVTHIDSDGSEVKLPPGDAMVCSVPEPLNVDFTLSSVEVDDETELTLTAIGDVADSFVWFDVLEDKVIGRGSPLTIKYTEGVGLRSIKLRAMNSINSLYGEVEKVNCLTVGIKEADEYFARVDAQIALTGGAYTDAWKWAIHEFVRKFKYVYTGGMESLKKGTFLPLLPASLDVMKIPFFDKTDYLDGGKFELQLFNLPVMEQNLLKTNGVDSYFVINAYTQNLTGLPGALFVYMGYDTTDGTSKFQYGFQINGSARVAGRFTVSSPHHIYMMHPNRATASNVLTLPAENGDMTGLMYYLNDNQTTGQFKSEVIVKRRGFDATKDTIHDSAPRPLTAGQTHLMFGGYGRIDDPLTAVPIYLAQVNVGSILLTSIPPKDAIEAEQQVDDFLNLQNTLGR